MDAKEATRILENAAGGCPRINHPDRFVHHAQSLTRIVMDTVSEIKRVLPGFAIDEEEMRIAGILHDIGRCFSSVDVHHPVVGGEFLEERGLPSLPNGSAT